MGWFSVVLEPVTIKQSASTTSEAVLLMALVPSDLSSATTLPAWQSRVQ